MLATLTLLALLQQPGGWTAVPARPTVGDTVWLARTIPVAPGWWVRAGRLPATSAAEPLGEPVVVAAPDAWTVRYPVVAWVPGAVTVAVPPVWRLGPDGSADSIPGGSATFTVGSVIPDSVRRPAPQPPLAPLRLSRRTPFPALAGFLVAAGILAAGVAWRRRPARRLPPPTGVSEGLRVADARWLAAGEPRAVAARAIHELRSAVARAVPAAHEALATPECLTVLERARSDAPVRELRELLGALDQVAFAAAHAADVGMLATRARTLAERVAP